VTGGAINRIALRIVGLLAFSLAACGGDNPQNEACRAMATGTLPWGYYPGYGCGPIPRAQTHFSGLPTAMSPVGGS
jgi:hypothetical protein